MSNKLRDLYSTAQFSTAQYTDGTSITFLIMSTLGIFLICYSSRGHQIVFSYPHETISIYSPEQSKPNPDLDASSHRTKSKLLGTENLQEDHFAYGISHSFKERILGFDSQTLSDLLSPKVALCDRKFELTVDQVTFVGHATLLNADRPGTGNRFARTIQKRHMMRAMASAAMQDKSANIHDISEQLMDTLSCNPTEQIHSNETNFPLLALNSTQSTTLTMFNVVIAMTPDSSGRNFSHSVDLMYSHVISKVTAAFKHEQLKRGYVKKEAEQILAIKEEYYPLLTSGKYLNYVL